MGSNNFFSKLASADPIAQALDLPGAHKYAQSQAQDVQSNVGPYAGQTPTLAAANVGYAPGTTAQGATPGWTPNQGTPGGRGIFGALQGVANTTAPTLTKVNPVPMPGARSVSNPFAIAAGNATQGGW